MFRDFKFPFSPKEWKSLKLISNKNINYREKSLELEQNRRSFETESSANMFGILMSWYHAMAYELKIFLGKKAIQL